MLVDELCGRYIYIEEVTSRGEVVSTGRGVVESTYEQGMWLNIILRSNELEFGHNHFVGMPSGKFLNIAYLED